MMFMELPIEIVDNIIEHTLPEGFESVALTCKRIYGQCVTFIAHHNELRSRFRTFEYYLKNAYRMKLNLMSSSDLLLRIAEEPVVARYIRSANFRIDSCSLLRLLPRSVPSIHDGGAIVDLFANSVYLKEAELDWKEYYTTFESDVREHRYSQHGAVFLLTLLPNIKKLIMPGPWKPNDATDKLLDTVIDKARNSTSSLTSVTRFEGSSLYERSDRCELRWVSPFLALPHVRSFKGRSCVGSEDIPRSLAFRDSHRIAETLQVAHLIYCCLDHLDISDFLRHAPSLKTLKYMHCTKDGSPNQDWDICKFFNAIELEAGSHLVQLSVIIRELQGSIIPGKASIRGFQQLQKLEIPLELVMCNIAAAPWYSFKSSDPFLDLIPSSVTQISLVSKGTCHHEKALDALFRHFQSNYNSQQSALKEMQISCFWDADEVYKDECARVLREARDKGVDAVEQGVMNCQTFLWGGEPWAEDLAR